MTPVRVGSRGSLVCAFFACVMTAATTWAAVVGSTSVTVNATPVDKTLPIAGRVTITTSQSGALEVTIDWADNYGRLVDRQVSSIVTPGTTSVTYSFPTQSGLTLLNKINVSARFPATGDTLSTSTTSWELVPDPIDHEDYHANVWGSDISSSSYFSSIRQANVNLGHVTRGGTFYGAPYNVRPNHDFIEDKLWFEMQDAVHDPNYNTYSSALSSGTYATPAARTALIRPQSLSSAGSLNSLVSAITPRMQATRKWRPLQWNMADEYGTGRRDYPFDYDLGPDCISQFITWLQGQYGTIDALNSQWGTHFTSWNDLSDPINAPAGGEAALITAQEMKDREYPLYSNTTAAKNFSPWSDFRRHMELTMAGAMQRCVDAARAIDTTVPIGWEGGETANAMNGYDYWLQMSRMGSFESYDLSNSPEYARSFRLNKYGEKLCRWITQFNNNSSQVDRYLLWFNLIHYGQRASIIWWYQDFFADQTTFALSTYGSGLSPAYKEFRGGLAKLLSQGEQDDGQIAIYYSQRSIHAGWMYDSESSGTSWVANKSADRGIATLHYVETGWLKALEDIGLKGRFVSYEQIAGGELINKGYKILIMPRTLAMSPDEIAAVQAFADAGGLVIADSQTAIFDGHCKRRSIAQGAGLMDAWFGVQRLNYQSKEYSGKSTDAYSGSVYLQNPPAGYEALTQNVSSPVSAGWHAVENGVRVADGSAVGIFGNDPTQPVLIVKNHNLGKSVYMNLTLMRYGRAGSGYTDDRKTPSSTAAANVRQLVRNLMALGGVTPKVRVLRGTNAPDTATDVYDLEKARFVDGSIVYLGCIVNSQTESFNWSTSSSIASTLFGQSGVSKANVTLVLDQPYHVYDVRNTASPYLGYGARINAQQPVYEGGVFALLPYKVISLRVDSMTFDAKQRASIRVTVHGDGTTPCGRHVLRVTVLDGTGTEVSHLTRNVVAPGGVWEDVIPFAISENLQGWHITVRDIATSTSVTVPVTPIYTADINYDGYVNVGDLQLLVAAWGTDNSGAWGNWNPAADLNGDLSVNVADLQILVSHWGQSQ